MSRGRADNALCIELGRRIRTLRERSGWTQADASAHLGIERGHLSEIETGKRGINVLTLQTIARGFGTTMSKLLKGM